jgi:putative oxidoreductase
MRIVVIVARILLGLMLFVFGLNPFLKFIPTPPMSGAAGDFLGAMINSHYVYLVGGVQVVSGLLLLINRYVPLAIALSGAVVANIIAYHVTMQRTGAQLAILATICWAILAWGFRDYFSSLWVQKASPK